MFEALPPPTPPTDEQLDEMRLRKLRGLTEEIEKHPDDYDRLRNVLAIHGGPLIDPSDYSSLETVIRLVRWLNAYPRSGGIA